MAAPTILASGWYAANIGGEFEAVDDLFAAGAGRRLAGRFRATRGLLIYRALRHSRGAALLRRERGALTVLVLRAAFGGPPVVILELIPDRPAATAGRRALKRGWFRCVERPAVRRGMRAGQALSAAETRSLGTLYGIGPERIFRVDWALCRTGEAQLAPSAERAGVLASGRAACDWETLFAAAEGASWPLTVVCGSEDRPLVDKLNVGGRARVLSEISRGEHDALMSSAAVFAMPLFDDGLSSGQVRLMTATELGTPVVASRVRTLADYATDGETVLLVEPGEPAALRAAIDALLADPHRRALLAEAALARARRRTYADYFRAVGERVEGLLSASGSSNRSE